MIIKVKVKTNSSRQKIEKFDSDRYIVYVKSKPEDGKANMELMNLLAKEFGVPAKAIHINFGRTSDEKLIEVKF